MRRWNLILSFLIPLFVAGNAMAAGNWFEDKLTCIVTGAVAGAAIGAAADGITVGGGTVGGAIIGALLCQPADADGDGVPDNRDKCPDTPKGVQVDEHGCPLDSDGDGVPDYKDKCPGTPKGAKVDADGCEIKPVVEVQPVAPVDGDSDGDGVPDSKDKCPGTPKGTKVDHTGCPLVEKIELKGVWFAFDSSVITPESAAVLDEVAKIFKRYPGLVAEMAGHTCSIGTEKYNQGLSERRANAVRDYLIKQGVDAKQLTAKGYGELQPLNDNATRADREKNRRTEMHILKQ
ncbi:MAG: OmpA family protein [Hydrogenophilaceae bacterium]|nr:OmpA family protein [Hydrogenophilaceae bacterium]